MAQELMPHTCPEFLRHKDTLIHPSKLDSYPIKYDIVVQCTGEIIITAPYAFHWGFNHGFNTAEAANFASPDWIEVGRRSKSCTCGVVKLEIDISHWDIVCWDCFGTLIPAEPITTRLPTPAEPIITPLLTPAEPISTLLPTPVEPIIASLPNLQIPLFFYKWMVEGYKVSKIEKVDKSIEAPLSPSLDSGSQEITNHHHAPSTSQALSDSAGHHRSNRNKKRYERSQNRIREHSESKKRRWYEDY